MLKHRRRRERAERRLAGTAENLERLGDLVREVRRQIRPLERQAAAARSHDSVATELLALRRYLAGAEQADLSARRLAAAQHLAVCRDEEEELHEALEQLDAEATSTTAELSSRREEDLANALGRVQGLVERARGLTGVLRERGRGVVAALDAAADVDVVSTLEAEAARLASELVTAESEEEAGGAPERAELQAALAALDEEAAALRERWATVLGDDAPDQAIARVRSRIDSVARAAAREQEDMDTLGGRVGTLEERTAGAAVRADLLAKQADELEQATAALEAELAARTCGARRSGARRRDGAGVGRRGRRGAPPHGGPGRGAGARAGGPAGRGRARTAARRRRRRRFAGRPGGDRRGLGRRLRGGHRRRGRRRGGRRTALGPGRAGHPARGRRDRGHPDAPAIVGLGRDR